MNFVGGRAWYERFTTRYFIMYTQTAVPASTSFLSYAKDPLRRCESFVHCMCMVIWKPIPHAASTLLPDRRQPGSCKRHKRTCKIRASPGRQRIIVCRCCRAMRGEDARSGGFRNSLLRHWTLESHSRIRRGGAYRGPVDVHCDNPQKDHTSAAAALATTNPA
jgi:hypothetical protein